MGDYIPFKLYLVVLIALLLPPFSSGQVDSSKLDFFPLHRGDIWQYYVGPFGMPGSLQTAQVETVDSLFPNGLHYAKIVGSPIPGPQYFRIDSLLRVQQYTNLCGDTCGGAFHETNYFRLNEKDSAIWKTCSDIANQLLGTPYYMRFNGTSLVNSFGEDRQVLEFQPGGSMARDSIAFTLGDRFYFTRGIGFVLSELQNGNSARLTGAIINGVQYGTIQTGVRTVQSTPANFWLGQNYPNPFNPNTIIPFSIAEAGEVRLAIFNLLGDEITVLLNERRTGGTYLISFNAATLPTGVYFYKLSTGGKLQVRRMMLLR